MFISPKQNQLMETIDKNRVSKVKSFYSTQRPNQNQLFNPILEAHFYAHCNVIHINNSNSNQIFNEQVSMPKDNLLYMYTCTIPFINFYCNTNIIFEQKQKKI